MYKRIISNDLRRNPLISFLTAVFVILASMLVSLAIILAINLYLSINQMLVIAKTPHFMQMHAGSLDVAEINAFARSQESVEEFQILNFLNIDGSKIIVGDKTLVESVQDNGFVTQSESFDYLLDKNSRVVYPNEGEIYVPIYYVKNGMIKVGDKLSVGEVEFVVAGMIRDSQMNAAMASSKRFLINESDFKSLQKIGMMEYLIEFRLNDTSLVGSLEDAYINAELPANGPPAITHSIFMLVNAIDDGMMIALLVLISGLVIAVSLLCVRFTLYANIEEDYK